MNRHETPKDTPREQKRRIRQPRIDRRLVGFALSGSLILAAVFYFEPFAPESEPLPEVTDADEPDLLIEDAVITQYRDTGAIKYLLRSPRIEHFQNRELTYLTDPDLSLHDDPEPPWRITSRRGTIRNASQGNNRGKEEVELRDDVVMSQLYDDGRSYELHTPSITIYPDREYAETSQDVMITTHAGRTQAVGLSGSLDEGLLQLFSNDEQRVHTIILPDQFK